MALNNHQIYMPHFHKLLATMQWNGWNGRRWHFKKGGHGGCNGNTYCCQIIRLSNGPETAIVRLSPSVLIAAVVLNKATLNTFQCDENNARIKSIIEISDIALDHIKISKLLQLTNTPRNFEENGLRNQFLVFKREISEQPQISTRIESFYFP